MEYTAQVVAKFKSSIRVILDKVSWGKTDIDLNDAKFMSEIGNRVEGVFHAGELSVCKKLEAAVAGRRHPAFSMEEWQGVLRFVDMNVRRYGW